MYLSPAGLDAVCLHPARTAKPHCRAPGASPSSPQAAACAGDRTPAAAPAPAGSGSGGPGARLARVAKI